MSVQIIPIEGYEISYLKFIAMCISPLLLLVFSPRVTEALMWGSAYCFTIIVSILVNNGIFRPTSVGYMMSFIFTFIFYYNLVYAEHVFSLDDFITLLKKLLYAYAICLILQQLVHMVGIRSFPLFNTMTIYARGWMAGNSLSIEPSHSARIVTAIFLSLLKLYEIKWGNGYTIKQLYTEDKWLLMSFAWLMLTMGSGTAIIGLMITALYFIKRKYVMVILPLYFIVYFTAPYIKYEPVQRAITTIEATMTLDAETISSADGSAAVRIVPIINTIHNLDLTTKEGWFGRGSDPSVKRSIGNYLEYQRSGMAMIGGIDVYGFLSYVFALVFIYSCCIGRVVSLESLVFLFLLQASINNIYVWWSIFMIFATVRYFQTKDPDSNNSTIKL